MEAGQKKHTEIFTSSYTATKKKKKLHKYRAIAFPLMTNVLSI